MRLSDLVQLGGKTASKFWQTKMFLRVLELHVCAYIIDNHSLLDDKYPLIIKYVFNLHENIIIN